MYLLRVESGLRSSDVAACLCRGRSTVLSLTRLVREDESATYEGMMHEALSILRRGRGQVSRFTPAPWPRSLGGYLLGLRSARERAQLTKKELAARASIAPETVSRLEHLVRPAE